MAAEFRFDQVTPGVGTPNRSRHDLVPNEIITLTATTPLPGAGITYTWELLDKRGSAALLSSPSGQITTIGPFGQIKQPSAFKVLLTVNDNGNITRSIRICSVRTLLSELRVPVFGETAPAAQTFDSNNPDLSTDNAIYVDRSGTGVTEQNAFDYTEWAWELISRIEIAYALAAGGLYDSDFAGIALGRLTRTGVSTYAVIKDNLVAGAPPTIANNISQGYQAGSIWVDQSLAPTNHVWLAAGEDAGDMIWVEVAGGGGSSNPGIKFHLRSGDNIVVLADYQYIVKSPAPILDGGSSLTISPGAQLVVLP